MTSSRPLKAPKHLKPATRQWWRSVVEGYELEQHHVRLLTMAGEAWDRKESAREAIVREGLTFIDRFGSPRLRPEVSIQRDGEVVFARLIRELALDVNLPGESRPPGIGAR